MDRRELHEVGADEAGEGEEAWHCALQRMGHAQQQVGDQGDGDLGSDGVFGGAEEAGGS